MRHSSPGSQGGARAFTIVEVLIGATLGSIVLLGVLTAFVFLVRTGYRIQNYNDMEHQAHNVLEHFAQDARMCRSTGLTLNDANSVTFTVPDYYAGNGNQVTYYYDASTQTLRRHPGNAASTAQAEVLMRHVTSCQFVGYDLTGPPPKSTRDNPPISGTAIKRIEITLTSAMNTSGNPDSKVATTATASENIMSATYLLRN